MKKRSDERLEEMLTSYCKAAPQQSFVYDPAARKEKSIPFRRMNRTLAAAASLVLISALSLTVYFLFGNKHDTPFAVAPSSQSVITPSSPTGESDSDPTGEHDPTEPTEARSGLQKLIDALFPKPSQDTTGTSDPNTTPNKKSTKPDTVKPTAPSSNGNTTPSPTQYNHGQSKTDPTDMPTEPDENPPVQPTEPPADPPCNEEPTDDPDDPWWWEPEIPTEGDVELPWLGPITVTVYIDSDIVSDDSRVFCKVYDQSGTRLGSSDLYDSSHMAELFERGEIMTRVSYETPDDLITSSGYYLFVFYDRNGKVMAQTQKYID